MKTLLVMVGIISVVIVGFLFIPVKTAAPVLSVIGVDVDSVVAKDSTLSIARAVLPTYGEFDREVLQERLDLNPAQRRKLWPNGLLPEDSLVDWAKIWLEDKLRFILYVLIAFVVAVIIKATLYAPTSPVKPWILVIPSLLLIIMSVGKWVGRINIPLNLFSFTISLVCFSVGVAWILPLKKIVARKEKNEG